MSKIYSDLHLLLDGHAGLVVHLHVADELLRNFFKDLFGEVSTADGILEFDELNDIASCNLTTRAQAAAIAIKFLHRAKVSIADADDND